MADAPPIGITGGTGLYEIPEMEIEEEVKLDTPFGDPSDVYIRGKLKGVPVIFQARHGRGHRITSPGVNYRANIYGFKVLGVDTLISVAAVGSMKEKYHPTDIVIPDQFYDHTKSRECSFFESSPAVHVDFADPVCPVISGALFESGKAVGAKVHTGGTYICIEGPAFSTRAESNIYRSWGVDVIGMTAAPEAKLAREAEICYASLSLVTDYDVWKEKTADVTAGMILANMRTVAETAKEIIKEAVPRVKDARDCACRNMLMYAIATDPDIISDETRTTLEPILGKYIPPEK
ncbi:MAG: S-methyl-5'-thioadenosine phosphorylase [Actinobacteria bacterium]|nr:S-methyl-5'-thioadenosine phosphorylase [Actinomycetota bacterium]